MRKFIMAVCASVLGITLSTSYAALASASGAVSHHAVASATIVVGPGESIQAAVNHANPGDTVLVKPGVYHQSVKIRTDGITLRGSGNSQHGTVLMPPAKKPHTLCTRAFGVTGVCILAKKVNVQTGAVLQPVNNDTVADMYITGFPANGVFGYGTSGLTVVNVSAVDDGEYGISRFESTRTLFAHDTAVGNDEAGFYVGDSPHADTVMRDNVAIGNQFGVFVRHARGVTMFHNLATKNCQGILVLDDGQRGGAGNTVIRKNIAVRNNKFCPKTDETPVNVKGGGILLLGATHTVVAHNAVFGNTGKQFNSGGIVVLSAKQLTHGRNPNHDTIAANHAFHNQPADLIWDGTGVGVHFVSNHCGTSRPSGLCP